MTIELIVVAVVAWGVGLGMAFYLWAYWRRLLNIPIPKDWMPQTSLQPRPPSRPVPPVASLYPPKVKPPAPPEKPKRRLPIHWPTPYAEAGEPPPSHSDEA